MRVVLLAPVAGVHGDDAAHWDPLAEISKSDKNDLDITCDIILLGRDRQPLSLMRSVAWSDSGENLIAK